MFCMNHAWPAYAALSRSNLSGDQAHLSDGEKNKLSFLSAGFKNKAIRILIQLGSFIAWTSTLAKRRPVSNSLNGQYESVCSFSEHWSEDVGEAVRRHSLAIKLSRTEILTQEKPERLLDSERS